MAFSSGTFSLVAGNPVVTATTISSTVMNNTLSDIATGLSTCILKDGTQTCTARIPFAQGISLGGSIIGTASQDVFNTVSTTVNAFGAASSALNIGHASAAAAFAGGISIPTGKNITGAGTAQITGFALIGGSFNGEIGGVSATPAAGTFTSVTVNSGNAITLKNTAGNGSVEMYNPASTGQIGWAVRHNSTDWLAVGNSGAVTVTSLAGTGTRTVVVDANGVLSAP